MTIFRNIFKCNSSGNDKTDDINELKLEIKLLRDKVDRLVNSIIKLESQFNLLFINMNKK